MQIWAVNNILAVQPPPEITRHLHFSHRHLQVSKTNEAAFEQKGKGKKEKSD